MGKWTPIQHWHAQENWNMGPDKPRRVINTTIQGRMITLEEHDRRMSVLLPQGMGVCRLIYEPSIPPDVAATMRGALEFERIKTIEMAEMWREGSNQWKRYMAKVAAIDAALSWLAAQEVTK